MTARSPGARPTELGRPRLRVEDYPLVTGQGRFVNDLAVPGTLELAIVRSPHPHARIARVDAAAALALPGVRAVLTGADMPAIPRIPFVPLAPDLRVPPFEPLDRATARAGGAPVAAVVAESRALAIDAAARVDVTYEPLAAVVDAEAALAEGAPLVYPEFGSNLCFRLACGSGDVEAAFAAAHRTVALRVAFARIAPAPLEPRGVLADYDRGRAELTLWLTTQQPHGARDLIALALDLPEHRVRVIAPDMGGGFGARSATYPEYFIAAHASRLLGRPVRWISTRSEDVATTVHARDQVVYVEAAADRDGHVTGLRARIVGNLGSYLYFNTQLSPWRIATVLPGCYRIPAYHAEVVTAFTNTTPTSVYRGAGRPQAADCMERLMDRLAADLDLDPVEIRRRNFIRPDEFPYTTASGITYDSGNYEGALDLLLQTADLPALRERQRLQRAAVTPVGAVREPPAAAPQPSFPRGESPAAIPPPPVAASEPPRAAAPSSAPLPPAPTAPSLPASPAVASLRAGGVPPLLGIGLACFVDPSAAGWEGAHVRVEPSGRITAATGSSAHGQGHETTFAQILSHHLGVPFDRIVIRHGDTAVGPPGVGTFAARSTVLGSSALLQAADSVVAKARRIAAGLLEADPDDVRLQAGQFRVSGADRAVGWPEVAVAAYGRGRLPPGEMLGLEAAGFYQAPRDTYGFGAALAVVQIDPDTGHVRVERLVAVDDCGTIVNPLLVDGQLWGGTAQGLGQALLERIVYQPDGALLTGSLMHYALPRASTMPQMTIVEQCTPSPLNPLGVKGVGEAGTIIGTAPIMNAVLDALAPLGITHLDMPYTPERVWAAIQQALRSD